MTKTVLRTQDNKKVIINTDSDPCLFQAPHNIPHTGTSYTRGKDLYAHESRNGNMYFYFYSWSMWQGEENSYYLVTKEEAEEFLLNWMGTNYGLRFDEAEKLDEQYNFQLTEETG